MAVVPVDDRGLDTVVVDSEFAVGVGGEESDVPRGG